MKKVDLEWLRGLSAGRVPSAGPECWDEVRLGVAAVRAEREDWDGEGAEAPHPEAVTGMVAFLAHLRVNGFPPPYSVYPLADGAVMAEWCFDYEEGRRDYMRVAAEVSARDPRVAEVHAFCPPAESAFGSLAF